VVKNGLQYYLSYLVPFHSSDGKTFLRLDSAKLKEPSNIAHRFFVLLLSLKLNESSAMMILALTAFHQSKGEQTQTVKQLADGNKFLILYSDNQ
jgi:hypothetical protein